MKMPQAGSEIDGFVIGARVHTAFSGARVHEAGEERRTHRMEVFKRERRLDEGKLRGAHLNVNVSRQRLGLHGSELRAHGRADGIEDLVAELRPARLERSFERRLFQARRVVQARSYRRKVEQRRQDVGIK